MTPRLPRFRCRNEADAFSPHADGSEALFCDCPDATPDGVGEHNPGCRRRVRDEAQS